MSTMSKYTKVGEMRIGIRTDSSIEIGTGHMARCLALAGELQKNGADVEFFCLDLPGNIAAEALRLGYPVNFLSSGEADECTRLLKSTPPFDAFVVDSYDLEAKWERPIRAIVGRLLVIDDLANRPHDCDFLVDPNFGHDFEIRYKGLVPANCRLLLGPSYALLRPEFSELRAKAESVRKIAHPIERLLIFFGGIDSTNETSKAIDALDLIGRKDLYVDVILGSNNPHRMKIQERLRGCPNFHYHVQVENMAEFMVSAHLAIGAGGTTSWERLTLGLPSLVVSIASNQTHSCINLAHGGYHFYLGECSQVDTKTLQKSIQERIIQADQTRVCGLNGMRLLDGQGCKRIAKVLTYQIP
jgi:UDP-2,4-diacetamido-2,4,6-trideoxy-beta-L-altropyranose hydrolase